MIVDFAIGLLGLFLFEAFVKPLGVALLQRKARAVLPELFEALEDVIPQRILEGKLNLRAAIEEAIGEIDPKLPERVKWQATELYLKEYDPAIAARNLAGVGRG